MHVAIAYGNDWQAFALESSVFNYLLFETKVQQLFSLEEHVLFLYVDLENETQLWLMMMIFPTRRSHSKKITAIDSCTSSHNDRF